MIPGPVRRALKGLLNRLGYRLVRRDDSPSQAELNLRQLARAYEHLVNSMRPDRAIPDNEARLQLLGRLLGTPPPKAYVIAQSLAETASLRGDVCEFGVAQGETSAFIANEILDSARRLHLFDSFAGLPPPSSRDALKDDIFGLGGIEAYTGTMACPEGMVVARLAAVGFPTERYLIHRGFIESVIGTDPRLPTAVSFAYVDFDFYEPIRVALDYLDRVLEPGGIIIVDDYDFFTTGAKAAVDEFIRDANDDGSRFSVEIPDTRIGHFALLRRCGGDGA